MGLDDSCYPSFALVQVIVTLAVHEAIQSYVFPCRRPGRNKRLIPGGSPGASNDPLIASSNQSDSEIRLAIRKLPVIGK